MHSVVMAILLAVMPVNVKKVSPTHDAKWTRPAKPVNVIVNSKELAFTEMYTDSSNNAYTFWSTTQDPIAVSGDTIVMAYRQYQTDGSGFVALTTTIDGGANWLSDQRVNEDAGLYSLGGRYPSAEVAAYPVVSWPELNSSTQNWGFPMVAAGDYSTPDIAVGVNPGDFGTHKSIAKRLPNGNVAVFGFDANYNVIAYVFDPVNGTMVGSADTVLPNLYPTAVVPDYNNGKIWLLAYDLNVGYRGWAVDINNPNTVVDSVDFVVPPVVECGTYEDTLGVHPDTIGPYNWYWLDGVVLNDGTPVIVADMERNHPTYGGLQQGIVVMRPDTSFYMVGPDSLLNVYYPQLAYDAATNRLFLLWEQMATEDTTLGYGRFEIYMAYSLDGGLTWSTPEKVLGDTTFNPSLFQVCRNVVNDRLYMAYMTNSTNPLLDVYAAIQLSNNHDLEMMYDHFGYLDVTNVGVTEKNESTGLSLKVKTNIGKVSLEFAVPTAMNVKVRTYTADGRLVNSTVVKASRGTNVITLPVSNLSNGIYFVNVEAGSHTGSARFVINR